MPFDLSGVAPNLQKAIEIILKPVLRRYVSVYSEDVIILSPSFTHHVKHLREVFKLLHEAADFNVEWEHRPGTQNVVVDLLSRKPVESIADSKISCVRSLVSREQLIQEQRNDPKSGHIYRYLENLEDIAQRGNLRELIPRF
ncbi:hypothetical protein TNCV_4071531 [Trichonephila clavipes]|uniref:Reverse transcriptase domain-containing protein n=1 Tax=Trichonephila clavipes TaxID=2585209 RepID=A0A8X6W7R8_TRICX|nr:hypothetical protein TNCV_4071531 [Trichonephila clavipes]